MKTVGMFTPVSGLRHILVVWLLLPAPSAALETGYLHGLGDSRYHEIRARELDRTFRIYVMLPDSYDAPGSTTYPALYVLDGGGLFPLLTSYYRYLLADSELPELIIIGISYGAVDFAGGNYRSTDFTAPSAEREYWGGASAFQRFLANDLIPDIEGRYRTDPERRILFGQSLGGQFVLFSAQTRPELFWGYIASNPALHRNLRFFLDAVPKFAGDARLFVASGTNDDPRFRQPAMAWANHWLGRDTRPWSLRVVDLEGHGHMSAPPAAFRLGARWLFDAE